MFFSPFLASRYLKPKRTFVSIITVISVLGVALGVWLLAVVIAVFTGYGERIKESILGFEPHMIVKSGGIMDDWYETSQKIKEIDGLTSVFPFVTGQVVMDFGGLRSAPMIRGIDPEFAGEAEMKHMSSKLARQVDPEDPENRAKDTILGEFDLSDPYKAVIGDGMADAQNINVGDRLLLYSPRDMQSVMEALDEVEAATTDEERKGALDGVKSMTAAQEVEITGIFDSGHWDFDANIIFVNLETAQVLYNFDIEQAHGLAIRTQDGFKVNDFKEQIDELLPEQYQTLTWVQMHQLIFNAVAAERQAMYLILFMIMIVGGFCIMNTMITVTFQKRSEIGLLKALGAREEQVASVFLFQGIIVGLIGVVVGLGIAEITIYFRNDMAGWVGKTFGVDLFSEEIYKVDGGLPAKRTLRDILIISGFSFSACTLASLVPAIIAANLQPAKALRSE